MSYVMSEPNDDDSAAMDAYRRRYVGAISTYFDDPLGKELAQYLEDLTTEERIVERLARLRGQYDALRGVLIDIDRLQEAMTERLFDVRKGRPLVPEGRIPPRQMREWNAQVHQILRELFGEGEEFTQEQLDQAMMEAKSRGIFHPADIEADS
jgi:hypothetical protein